MDIWLIARIMLKLFLIMALGFVLAKTGIIDKHTNTKLSGLISKITMPLLVISSVLSSTAENYTEIFIVLGVGILMYIGFMIFGKIICFLFQFPKKDRPIYECMLVFSNNSFMGYPILQSILGERAIFYTAMIHFAFNIFIFSYGVNAIEKCGKRDENVKFQWKKLLNPGFILVSCALVLFVTGIRDQGIVYETVSMVGNVTSPLSMIVLGASLAAYPIKESITDWRSYLFAVARLGILPVITFFVCRMLGVNDFFTTIVTITNGMPVASMVLMLGNEAQVDTSVIIKNIFVTTVLSTFTVPILVGLLF